MIGAPADMLSLLLLGFLLGVRHATDADHVIAVGTILSREGSVGRSALIGAAWGIGHTITVLVVGGAIILLGVVIPPRIGLAMEFSVGVMLVLLGTMTLLGGGTRRHSGDRVGDDVTHDHVHAHGAYAHRHRHGHGPASHGHTHEETPLAVLDRRFGRHAAYRYAWPLVVGVVHGLAGSAAIALLVLAAVRDSLWGVAYLAVFGVGTVAGMMMITLALAIPFTVTSSRMPRLHWRLRVTAGLLSFCAGVFLVYEIGFVDSGLFTDTPIWNPT